MADRAEGRLKRWVALCALVAGGQACARSGPAGAEGQRAPAPAVGAPAPRSPRSEPAARALPWGEVTLPDRAHSPTWRVEIAEQEAERSRGLMFRRSLPDGQGMIFVMPYDDDWAFYMRNTYVPLDMVFVDRHWRVVGLQENTRPLTETLLRGGAPARYVLELAAHQARKHGIRVGTRLALRRLPPDVGRAAGQIPGPPGPGVTPAAP